MRVGTGGIRIRVVQPVVAKFRTFDEAETASREYYRRLSPEERLEILFQLVEMVREESDAAHRGPAHVYRIAQLKRG
jgi:hypothetical protein